MGKVEVSGILLRTYGIDSSNEVKKLSLNGFGVRIECIGDFGAAFPVFYIVVLFGGMSEECPRSANRTIQQLFKVRH